MARLLIPGHSPYEAVVDFSRAEVARAHGEVFGDIRPASTCVVVSALLDPRWRVAIEADAVLPAATR